jgi:predicted nucleotidyltransferase
VNDAETLLKTLVENFSKSPEIFLIGTFGSAVDQQMDAYSDVDIIICSNDLKKTKEEYKKIIESISPIIASSPFYIDKPNVISEIIYLKNFKPYQKIDLTIIPYLGYLSDFNPQMTILFENQLADREQKSGIEPEKAKEETLDEWMMKNIAFVIGFCKSYKRKNMEMYRYWDFIKDAMLILLFEKHDKWTKQYDKLMLAAPEFKNLFYRSINKSEFDFLQQVLPPNGKLDLKISFITAFFLFSELIVIKSDGVKEYVNREFLSYIKHFLQSEMQ